MAVGLRGWVAVFAEKGGRTAKVESCRARCRPCVRRIVRGRCCRRRGEYPVGILIAIHIGLAPLLVISHGGLKV